MTTSITARRAALTAMRLALLASITMLLASCASQRSALPAVRPDDADIRYAASGIVKLEAASAIRIIDVDGIEEECPRACSAGLRLPVGRHQVTVMRIGESGSEKTIEMLIEPRRIYEIRRVDAAFGVIDLGEPVQH